jgi:putative ATPase
MHIRNAVTRHMKEWGYGKGYEHAHTFEDALPGMECLPDSLAGQEFYHPTQRGLEQRIAERLAEIRAKKAEKRRGGREEGTAAEK